MNFASSCLEQLSYRRAKRGSVILGMAVERRRGWIESVVPAVANMTVDKVFSMTSDATAAILIIRLTMFTAFQFHLLRRGRR